MAMSSSKGGVRELGRWGVGAMMPEGMGGDH
jgi:hypothetical protein